MKKTLMTLLMVLRLLACCTAGLAEADTADEQYAVALDYYLKLDRQNALIWAQKAAENGSADAMNMLGMLYHNGLDVEKDLDAAKTWFEKSAALGNSVAMFNLGLVYEEKGEYAKAIEWFETAQAHGEDVEYHLKRVRAVPPSPDTDERYLQAVAFYENGQYEQVLTLLEPLADEGNSDAMNLLGLLYKKGLGVEKDLDVAMRWFEKSVSLGNKHAMFNLGMMYENVRNYEQALEWLEKAQANGCDAQDALRHVHNAIAYYDAYDLFDAGQYEQALPIFEKLAEEGYDSAMHQLGYMYKNGLGIDKDPEMAKMWYEKAAALGNSTSMSNLGLLYEEKADYAKAIGWYEKAIAHGYDAQKYLDRARAAAQGGQSESNQKSEPVIIPAFDQAISGAKIDSISKNETGTANVHHFTYDYGDSCYPMLLLYAEEMVASGFYKQVEFGELDEMMYWKMQYVGGADIAPIGEVDGEAYHVELMCSHMEWPSGFSYATLTQMTLKTSLDIQLGDKYVSPPSAAFDNADAKVTIGDFAASMGSSSLLTAEKNRNGECYYQYDYRYSISCYDVLEMYAYQLCQSGLFKSVGVRSDGTACDWFLEYIGPGADEMPPLGSTSEGAYHVQIGCAMYYLASTFENKAYVSLRLANGIAMGKDIWAEGFNPDEADMPELPGYVIRSRENLIECPVCHGDGLCTLCGGSGIQRLYGETIVCQVQCSYCKGDTMVKVREKYYELAQ